MGVSKMLRQPEFLEAPLRASQVMEVIEERQNFIQGLENLDLNHEPRILIGEENIFAGIESCSLIVLRYEIDGYHGYMGILGPKRMAYAFNSALLTEVCELLESNQL